MGCGAISSLRSRTLKKPCWKMTRRSFSRSRDSERGGDKACVHAPAHLVIHPVQRVGHIGSGDALQRSAAHTPIETRKACGGKFAQGIFLSDVWPKNLDWVCVHQIS